MPFCSLESDFQCTGKLRSLRYAPPCVLIWILYLVAYWPALMSPDSIAQWDQIVKTSFSNNYPAFHTLTNWLITRIWLSPAVIAIAQIIALAIVFSLTLIELERWGVTARVRGWITVFFCLSPVNGMMVVTLWKDIPYTCAALGLFKIVLQIVRTDGKSLLSARGMISLWLALVLISLFRHNGVPVVGLFLFIFLIVYRQVCFRQLARVGVNWLLFFIIITGPIYRLIGVFPMAKFFALQNVMHQVGAMLSAGAIKSTAELSYLAAIQPIESWLRFYDCYSLNGLIYNENVRHEFMEANGSPILDIWFHATTRHPEVLLAHQMCITTMLWQVAEPAERNGRLYSTERGIVANDLGLKTESLWPKLRESLSQMIDWSLRPNWVWLLWRPAIYFYGLLFCVGLAVLRTENRMLLLTATPAVLNTLVWLPLITTQDFRFQYPIYVMALIAPALLFLPHRTSKDASAPCTD